jgi:hypothetical protein
MQLQDGSVPYTFTKRYSVNISAQLKSNIEADRGQQQQLNNLKINSINHQEEINNLKTKVSTENLNDVIAAYMSANYENGNTGAY